MVLHSGGAAFAAAWGYTIYFLASNSWAWPAFMGHMPPLTHAAAVALGGLAGAVAALVLVFVCSVLVNIADALFICFVLDKDSSAVTWWVGGLEGGRSEARRGEARRGLGGTHQHGPAVQH